jgi:uncharacterized damage-inducible protein DinB
MNPYSEASIVFLKRTAGQALEQLEGIPEDDLNDWRPSGNLRDINTFFGLATHIAGAGEFWILEAAGGRSLNRERLAEFRSRGSLDDLRVRYDRWLADSAEVIRSLSDERLAERYVREADPDQGITAASFTVAECIVHAVEHTALHAGHLQIQRQLWDAERGGR